MHAAAAPKVVKRKRKLPSLRVVGRPGTQMSGGQINTGERTSLRGRALVDRAEQLQRTETAVTRMLRLVKGTSTSCSWRLEGGDESALGREVFAACEEALGLGRWVGRGQMRRDFSTVVDPFHLFWWLGYRYGEIVWRVGRRDDDRLMFWVDDILDCEPSAHDQWVSADNRTLDGVVQRRINAGDKPEVIPADKLWLVTWQQTGANWEGLGACRPCSWSAKAKEHVILWMMRHVERSGSGVPMSFVDLEVAEKLGMSMDDEEIKTLVEELDEALGQMKAGSVGARLKANSLVYPKSYGDASFDVGKWIALVELLNNEIHSVASTNFATLGETDTGSRAVGEVHGSFFRRLIVEILDLITSSFTAQVLRRFVHANFGAAGVRVMPAVRHIGLDIEKMADAINVLPALQAGGLLGGKQSEIQGVNARVVDAVLQVLGIVAPTPRTADAGPAGAQDQFAVELLDALEEREERDLEALLADLRDLAAEVEAKLASVADA